MKDRRLHIYIVALILAGPVVTLIAEPVEALNFLFYLFPVTISSIDLRVDPEQVRELRIVGMIFPLLHIKILVFGVIAVTKLIQDREDHNCLRRFYIMILFVTSVKLLSMLLYYELDALDYVIGLFTSFQILGLLWLLKKRTHNHVHNSWQHGHMADGT